MNKILFALASFALVFGFTSCQEDEKLNQKTDIIEKVTGNDLGETYIDEAGNSFDPVKVEEQAAAQSNQPITRITYTETKVDLGEVTEGTDVRHSFEFKNTGHEPLIIQSAQGSCGCTIPNYSKTPVAPGQLGYIDVVFDSKGRPGINTKDVTIIANTNPSVTKVSFTVKVNPK
ncbi:MAG TPA: DUF1573 domain-containing protein [Chitinophagales bacterium]|nr:DUF1573 domain-containing protein [Chitinophagales bacterium]